MKRKLMAAAAAACFAALLGGCSSVQCAGQTQLQGQTLTESGESVAHVNVYAAGLYWLCFPLVTGDPADPGSIAFFRDTVTVTNGTRALTAKSKSLQATHTENLASNATSAMLPLLFHWQSIQISGNAVR